MKQVRMFLADSQKIIPNMLISMCVKYSLNSASSWLNAHFLSAENCRNDNYNCSTVVKTIQLSILK